MRLQTKHKDEVNFTCWAHAERLGGKVRIWKRKQIGRHAVPRAHARHMWYCVHVSSNSKHGGCDVNISCLSWSRLDMKINKAEFAS